MHYWDLGLGGSVGFGSACCDYCRLKLKCTCWENRSVSGLSVEGIYHQNP